MKQYAQWSKWLKLEGVRLFWSFLRQWNSWRMWQQHHPHTEEFKARLRKNIRINKHLD